jgi:hypothetical protein
MDTKFEGLTPEQLFNHMQKIDIRAKDICRDLNIEPQYLSNFKNGRISISHIAQCALYFYVKYRALEKGIKLDD